MKPEQDPIIVNNEGKILFFPIDIFKEHICSGNNCIICGRELNATNTNEEHILPNWILRKFKLHNQLITLSNGTKYRYAQYTIPCCVDCNSFYGETIEKPIQQILSSGYKAIVDYVQEEGPYIFLVWISYIFFKTHYKDLSLRMTLDRSKNDDSMIGDQYEWESMHHIYSVARSIYVNAQLDNSALSSLYILPVNSMDQDIYDYCDLYPSKSIFIQHNDVVIIGILNDGCACSTVFYDEIKSIDYPLIGFQTIEFFARLSYINLLLENRTSFTTQINSKYPRGFISGEPPDKIVCNDGDPEEFGEFYYTLIKDGLNKVPEITEETHELIKQGKWTFLFKPAT